MDFILMIVELTKDQVRVCTMLAVEKWLQKWESTDKPNYAEGKRQGYLEHDLNASIRANVCECAVSVHYNTTWNVPFWPNELHARRNALPDVGAKTEVRNVRTQDSIPFWKKDGGKIIVGTKVLDEDHYSKIEIYGHINADDYMLDKYWDKNINGWRVPVQEFRV